MELFILILPNFFILSVVALIAYHLNADRAAIKTNQRAIITFEKDVMIKLNDLTDKKKESLDRLNAIEKYLKIHEKTNGK